MLICATNEGGKMKHQPEQGKDTSLSTAHSLSANGDEIATGNSSIIEFLNQEQKCLIPTENDLTSDLDIDSIFEEINRLSGESDERSVDEILREAELLLSKQQQIETDLNRSEHDNDDDDDAEERDLDGARESNGLSESVISYNTWHFNEHLETISEKTTPRNTKSQSSDSRDEQTLQTIDDLESDGHVSAVENKMRVFVFFFFSLFHFIRYYIKI